MAPGLHGSALGAIRFVRLRGGCLDIVAISIGAVLGANARYLVGGWLADRLGATFPYGTLVINLTGSFLIGLVMVLVAERALAPGWVRTAIAIGFLGSYTTFSTFSYETLGLVNAGNLVGAAINIGASVGGALVGVYLGTIVARLV